MALPVVVLPVTDNVRKKRVPIATYALLVANILFHLYNTIVIGDLPQSIQSTYGVNTVDVACAFSSGEPLLIASSAGLMLVAMFVHAGWWHLVGNMVELYAFGPALEVRFGWFGFLAFYLLAGFIGTIGFVLVAIHDASAISSIGASVAIAAMAGAYLILWPAARLVGVLIVAGWLPVPFVVKAVWVITLSMLLQALDGALAANMYVYGINRVTHFFGFVTGLILASLALHYRWLQPAHTAGQD